MKNVFKIISISLMILSSQVSYAAPNVTTVAATINAVTNWSGGGDEKLWIKLNGNNTVNPGVCDLVGWYILRDTASDFARSMVLGAKLSNQKITFVIYGNGCFGDAPYSRPVIVNVGLPDQ